MTGSVARSSNGQLKIQQMAFVLVAFMILLGFVALFYLSVRSSSLRENVNDIRHEQAQERVRKLASTPEFSWTLDDCARCVDIDKVLALKNKSQMYRGLWGTSLVFLRVQNVYPLPSEERECTPSNYPDCSRITLVELEGTYSSEEAFVALCHLDGPVPNVRCTLGKLIMGVQSV